MIVDGEFVEVDAPRRLVHTGRALYDPELAGFGESGGLFSQQASPGFIELWTLQSRMAYAIRNRGKDGA